MNLKIIEGDFTVSKISKIEETMLHNEFVFLALTDQEISLVCKDNRTPKNTISKEKGYKLIRIEGLLDFSMVGILSTIATILADNEISIFVISTYNTDYFLVKDEKLDQTKSALIQNGYQFI